jgi:hypothetical protein
MSRIFLAKLRRSEIPFCFDLLGDEGSLTEHAAELPIALSKFGCIANCDDCPVMQIVTSNGQLDTSPLDAAGLRVHDIVREMYQIRTLLES